MKTMFSLALALATTTALAQESGLKPGLWEIKIVHQVMDGRDMSSQMSAAQDRLQQAMANMAPEKRAQIEAIMASKGLAPAGAGGAARICISAAMASNVRTVADPEGKCPPATVNRSGNTIRYEFACTSNGRTTSGKGTSTIDGDTVTNQSDVTSTDARGSHTMQTETRMSYVGADCQGIKPADALAGNGAGMGH